MKYQPNSDYSSDDDVQTPQVLADGIVRHFRPRGSVLEPCAGEGNFLRAFDASPHKELISHIHAREIKSGLDFRDWSTHVDWIITNPPWSQLKTTKTHIGFIEKSFHVATNVVFVLTINHAVGLRARYRMMEKYNFGIKEILLFNTPPKPWPQSGFQLGAVHWQFDYRGPWVVSWMDVDYES